MSAYIKFPTWYLTSDTANLISKDNDTIIYLPTEDEIIKALKLDINSSFAAPYLPPEKFKNFFIVKRPINQYGLLTTQQKIANVEEHIILQNNLGISVVKSDLSFENLAGAVKLKNWSKKFKIAEEQGYRSKGIFLVGLPGTGKTFFAQCLAGELKRPLVILNLALLKAKNDPIEALNDVFEYLNNTNSKQIILIDEIEKMVGTGEDPLTGRLMTILSDLYSSAAEYKKLDVLVLGTANSVDAILKHQPALLRRGRWDEMYFQNTPKEDNVKEYFELYMNKYGLSMLENCYGIDKIINDISKEYRHANVQSNNFIYTPSEIATFYKRLYFEQLAGTNIDEEVIKNTIKEIVPISMSAQEGVNKIIAQKQLFTEI